MILNEQILNNLSKSFYHGTKHSKLSKEFAKYDVFYITTSFPYAMIYAKEWAEDEDGYSDMETYSYKYIMEFRIVKPLNICNLKSKNDYNKVLPKAIEAGIGKDTLDDMIGYDWYQFTDNAKTKLVNVIKSLGYDGFFNWELSPLKYSSQEDKEKSAPSFGIFDINDLKLVKIWEPDEFEDNKHFKKQKELETKNIRRILFDNMVDLDWGVEKLSDFGQYAINESGLFGITKQDILDYKESLEQDDLEALWKLRRLYIDMEEYTHNFEFDDEAYDEVDRVIDKIIYKEAEKDKDSILKDLDNTEILCKAKIEDMSSGRKNRKQD